MQTGSIISQQFDAHIEPVTRNSLFRLYTENKNVPLIKEILDEHLESYTVFFCMGVWHGEKEQSLVIEILGPSAWRQKIEGLEAKIRTALEQQAVLLTETPCQAALVCGK